MHQRQDWIDIAKGVGIILVVVGHAGRGLQSAGLTDEGWLLPLMDRAIYAFHMPLFFVLSGVTFGMRPPANIRPALTRKIWRLFYAMVIWTYTFLAVRALAGNNTNASGSWEDLMVLPIPPFAHFWFLWALLLNMVAFTLFRLALRPFVPDLSFWIIAFVISAFAQFAAALPEPFQPYFGQAINYALAFTLGAIIGASSLHRRVPNLSFAMLGALFFPLGLWASVAFDLPLSGVGSGAILAILLLLPLIRVSALSARLKWAQFLLFLGEISLGIYVMHTIFSAAMRILLLKTGIDGLTIHLVLGIAIGIFGPLVTYMCARRLKMLRIAGLV